MGALLSTSLTASDRWLLRFGDDVPAFARVLRAAVISPSSIGDIREAAEALGVLRAQQGHAVSAMTEDLLGLRDVVGRTTPEQLQVVDTALQLGVAAYVDELVAVLASKATRDPLTGLPNRAVFEEAVQHELAGAGRHAGPTLLLVDLDKFKHVNDTEGHLAGDAVLVALAELLRGHLRPSDVACRLGGDEFAVVLPRTAASRGAQIARRLLTAARKAPGLAGASTHVTLSIGVGWSPHATTTAELVALADRALYAAKAAGGDDVRAGE